MSQQLLTLVTGANQGLGYYAAEILTTQHNHKVLVGCRDLEKGKAAVAKLLEANPPLDPSQLEPIVIDLEKDDTITAAAEYIKTKYGYLDILINNAAGYTFFQDEMRKEFNHSYNTNVVGTHLVTQALVPLLKASKAPAPGRRIVFVSSTLGSVAVTLSRPPQTAYLGYSITKSALNGLAGYYTVLLKEDGITVTIVCPGYCATNLNNYSGTAPPEDGAKELVAMATQGGLDMTGKWFRNGEEVPW
ncbi:NAD(P)-binding protein [Trichodelitschia bisporula]|uniref:NAD(P)-binding protein n=1 Tax=Trichodelitschia bisporula TaxID=703511 RepID=A0A6G1I8U7_9PEZI|nr:NAD(P)-binding protein [Trichodelitschia bisporula]